MDSRSLEVISPSWLTVELSVSGYVKVFPCSPLARTSYHLLLVINSEVFVIIVCTLRLSWFCGCSDLWIYTLERHIGALAPSSPFCFHGQQVRSCILTCFCQNLLLYPSHQINKAD